MTKRAKRAIAVLQKLGWDVYDDSLKLCSNCSKPLDSKWLFCPSCGEKAPKSSKSAIREIEMAIKAALEE
jgi:predicted amidophosphoribosyltransferase